MKQILEVLGAIDVLLALIYVVAYVVFLSRLKNRHVQKWNKLGKPGVLRNNTIFTTWATIVFLFHGDIGDFALFDKRLVYTLRVVFVLLCALMGVFMFGLIVGGT
jgi:hypothetical protein